MTPELKAETLHSLETTGEVISVTTAQIASLMSANQENSFRRGGDDKRN
jgi:hypothetical protein